MTLPLTGPLSLTDIQAEFGGTDTISLSEYYKGGPYVHTYSLAPNVPTSGPIAISDFYGAAQYIPTVRTVILTDGQTFTVPASLITPLTLTLISAPGGTGGTDVPPGYPGYPGHVITGNVTANSGDVFLASVGGPGGRGQSGTQGGGGSPGPGGTLGYSGGTGGGAGYAGSSGAGGGGGGATVVTQNGTPVAVAGGGAGGGGAGWHSAGRPTQGYSSSGSIMGGNGQSKNGHGGGGGGGGGGQLGGAGGATYGGDEGAWSGSSGADLVPSDGTSTTTSSNPTVIIQGVW